MPGRFNSAPAVVLSAIAVVIVSAPFSIPSLRAQLETAGVAEGVSSALPAQAKAKLDQLQNRIRDARAVGDRDGEASALTNIGNIYSEVGDWQKALAYYGQALPVYRAAGDRNR